MQGEDPHLMQLSHLVLKLDTHSILLFPPGETKVPITPLQLCCPTQLARTELAASVGPLPDSSVVHYRICSHLGCRMGNVLWNSLLPLPDSYSC